MNKRRKKVLSVALWGECALLLALNGFGVQGAASAKAYYCDDGAYEGEGTHVSTTYTVEYDDYVEHNEYRVRCAPSMDNAGSGATNGCTAIGGMNVVAFYDRYYTNLIPNYDPGIEVAGHYRYLPNLGSEAIKTLHATMYSYMNVNVNFPGASEDDFKSGLSRYVTERGYNIGYSSIYQDSKNVNLAQVRQMVNNHKVAMLFLTGYNFVFDFNMTETKGTVYQEKSDAGHVLMVYGYFTIDYYRNNQVFLTETFLEVASCNSNADLGYIKMNDYGRIDDAVIVQVS